MEGKTPAWIVGHHTERYKFAARYCKDKDVLDVGCGTGYGSRILLQEGHARRVVGVDVSPEAIEYAKASYEMGGLEFHVGDILTLPSFHEGAFRTRFDVVVAFEFIEHLLKPRAAISAISSFLCPPGLLIISTPNRTFNSPWIPSWEEPLNSFHVREFTRREFQASLQRHFSIIERYGQYVFPGRYIGRIFSDYVYQDLTRHFSTQDGCQLRPLRFYEEAHTMVFVGRLTDSEASIRRFARKLRRGVLWAFLKVSR